MKVLKPLVDEHANPKHASKRDVHNQLTPIMALVAAVRKQFIEDQAILDAIELSEGGTVAANKIEHLRQTFAAIEREIGVVADGARSLAKAYAQKERIMTEVKALVEREA